MLQFDIYTPKCLMKKPTSDLPHQNEANLSTRTAEQNAQARLVLIQLQWLMTLLLVSAMVWLGNNQRKLEHTVEERLKITQEFNARLNDMDDRLFAFTPTTTNTQDTHNAENDLHLIQIQLISANQLHQSGNYPATEELLQSLLWQLNSNKIHIATPIKTALSENLRQDIERLNTLKSLPDDWQAHIIKMREVQSYLRQTQPLNNELNRQDLARHDAIIMLGLAIGAATVRERSTMTNHLQEAQANLELLQKLNPKIHTPSNQANNTTEKSEQVPDKRIDTLEKAIYVINELLANPPTIAPLSSLQVLKK